MGASPWSNPTTGYVSKNIKFRLNKLDYNANFGHFPLMVKPAPFSAFRDPRSDGQQSRPGIAGQASDCCRLK